MNKLVKEASIFFEKNQKTLKEEFCKRNTEKKLFSITLNSTETNQLESLFIQNQELLDANYKDVFSSIKNITIQIKSIQKQHILLIGEKIYKVRSILNMYKFQETTFSCWIDLVFKTKSSAYNALSYYELFINLPNEKWKNLFQSIPYKTAYLLASRKGDIEKKKDVLKKIQGLSNTPAISVLNKFLPSNREVVLSPTKNTTEDINKVISEKLLDLIKIVSLCEKLSPYNENLLRQFFEQTLNDQQKESC